MSGADPGLQGKLRSYILQKDPKSVQMKTAAWEEPFIHSFLKTYYALNGLVVRMSFLLP